MPSILCWWFDGLFPMWHSPLIIPAFFRRSTPRNKASGGIAAMIQRCVECIFAIRHAATLSQKPCSSWSSCARVKLSVLDSIRGILFCLNSRAGHKYTCPYLGTRNTESTEDHLCYNPGIISLGYQTRLECLTFLRFPFWVCIAPAEGILVPDTVQSDHHATLISWHGLWCLRHRVRGRVCDSKKAVILG